MSASAAAGDPVPEAAVLAAAARERAELAAAAAAALARADDLAADHGALAGGSRARWGWRRALRFAARQRMLGPGYWRAYARWLRHRVTSPGVELEGMVFFGRGVDMSLRAGAGRLRIGPWSWLGNGTSLRAHEGSVRLGAKVVLGSFDVVNAFLDVEIGGGCLFGDWVYVCDFDHVIERVDVPIRKQGVVKSPVRIGEDVWVGEKATILRGADIGAGSVVASQALVRGTVPPFSVVVGSPARIVRSRLPAGMTAEEALDLQHRGRPIPGDPLAP